METWNDDSFSSDSSSDITDVSPASSLSDFGDLVDLEKLPIKCADKIDIESPQIQISETIPIQQPSVKHKTQDTESLLLSAKSLKNGPVKKVVRSPAIGRKNTSDYSSTLVLNTSSNLKQENEILARVENEKKEHVMPSGQAEGGDLQLLVDALGELEGGGQPVPMRLPRTRLNLSFTPEKVHEYERYIPI
jgi:hypothetical protein